MGKLNASRVTLGSQLLQRRSPGIAEAQQPRALVEGLAGGVVQGLTDHLEIGAGVGDVGQQSVAAAGDQAQKRRLERVRSEEARRDVTVQMVDGGQRQRA